MVTSPANPSGLTEGKFTFKSLKLNVEDILKHTG